MLRSYIYAVLSGYVSGRARMWRRTNHGWKVVLSYCFLLAIVKIASGSHCCTTPCFSAQNGNVRLVGGSSSTEGRVQVCRHNFFGWFWGRVCGPGWGDSEAIVVCRQLGYPTSGAVADLSFGYGVNNYVFLYGVNCVGTETRLIDCSQGSYTGCTSQDAGVRCLNAACTHGSIRLAGSSSTLQGRVEVCVSGQWGTVCDDSWSTTDANVACRQLGFSNSDSTAYSSAFFGQGSSLSILLDDVACTGSESRLVDCSYDSNTADCSHSEDAGVQCQYACTHGTVRLIGGSSSIQGRVEACISGLWGTVCDDFWSSTDANIVCSQLGYSNSDATAYYNAYFGQGALPILLDDVACTGSESRLVDCSYDSNAGDCSHSDDAGVQCQYACTHGTIRLIGGSSSMQGRVEACISGLWGTVCDDFWSSTDANIVCSQLGYSNSDATAYYNAYFGQGTLPILLDDVACTGSESRLVDCTYDSNTADCPHSDDAGVGCQPSCLHGSIRIVGGTYSFEGRVEVCVSGLWGTVCDDLWSTADGKVVCKQLGYSVSDVSVYYNAYYGQGSLPILLDDVACTGSESSLVNCSYDSNTADCPHSDDAGVRCHTPPTQVTVGSPVSSTVTSGQSVFYNYGFPAGGLTIRLNISIGSIVCYASDIIESPNEVRGYDWKVEANGYIDVFLDPTSLGRPAGSVVYIALNGVQATNSFNLGSTAGDTSTTDIVVGSGVLDTLSQGQFRYYEYSFPVTGLTVRLDVGLGRVVCYASDRIPNPSEDNGYDWKIEASGFVDTFLDPASLGRPAGVIVFVALQGVLEANNFTLNSTTGNTETIDIVAGSGVLDTLIQGQFRYYEYSFPVTGLTVRLDVGLGRVLCYASDRIPNPSEDNGYDWKIEASGFVDTFLDPASLGRPAGVIVFIALQGVLAANNFTLNSTTGNTETIDIDAGSGVLDTLSQGQFRYYEYSFPVTGLTVRLDVGLGRVVCYASDRIPNPSEDNGYDWKIEASGFVDTFLDPASLGRQAGVAVFIALQGVLDANNFTLNSTTGNTETIDIVVGSRVLDTLSQGQFRYYEYSFPVTGLTVRLDVGLGRVVCYASDRIPNPSEDNGYDWKIEASGFVDTFLDPASLGRPAGVIVFIALQGVLDANNFTLNSTTGNTETIDIVVGSGVLDTLSQGQFRYYEYSFPVTGLTVRLDIGLGRVVCYASDRIPNPSEDNGYDWKIEASGFVDTFLDPASLGRPAGVIVFIALQGVLAANNFTLNSTTGNTETIDIVVGSGVLDTLIQGQFRYYEYSFPVTGLTVRLDVGLGRVVCYASDRIPNPSEDNGYDWKIEASGFVDTFLDPASLGRPAGVIVFIALQGVLDANNFTLNSTTGNTETIDIVVGSRVLDTLSQGQFRYYEYSFPVTGLTIQLNVGLGLVVCYASDRILNPSEDNGYDWKIEASGFVDTFLDPASLGRQAGVAVFIALQGVLDANNFTLNSTTGNTETIDTAIGAVVNGAVGSGIFEYYELPFPVEGLTLRLDVGLGYIICFASDSTPNPSEQDYNWKVEASGFADAFLDPSTIGRVPGDLLFIAIKGSNATNTFTLNTTFGDTSTRDIAIGTRVLDNVDINEFKYYELPFPSGGITIILYVLQGSIICYASNTVPNPNEDDFDWRIEIDEYTDAFLSPGDLDYQSRNIVFVALQGVQITSNFTINTTIGDTATKVPDAPMMANINSVATTSASIMWEPPISVTQTPLSIIVFYQLILSEGKFNTPDQYINTTSISYTFTGLEEFNTYSCRVAAINGVGRGQFGSPINFTTLEAAPSTAPRDFVATPTSPRSVILTWDPPLAVDQNGDIIGYVINVTLLETGEKFQLYSSITTLNVGSLRPYSTYICVIAAQTSAGLGPFSISYVVATPEDVPTQPEIPTVTRIAGSPMALLVKWSPPAEKNGIIIAYTVYCYESLTSGSGYSESTSGEGSGTTDTLTNVTVPGNNTQTVVGGLIPYTVYTCYITARTSAGEGNPSDAKLATTDESVPADPPADFRASVTNSTAILLTWSQPLIPYGVVVSYTITYNLSEVQTSVIPLSADMNGGGGPLLITGLNEYTVYEFQVFASTRIGAGPSAAVIERTDESYPYAPPRDVQSFVTGSRTATISWIPPVAEHRNGPIIYYTLVAHNEVFNVSDVVINATNTDYSLTNLEEYSTYRLRVAAATKIGLGPYSNPIAFNTPQDAPSASPQSFTGYSQSPTLISLMWLPPLDIDLNGVLQQYVIQVKEVWTDQVWRFYASETHINIGPLHPYYIYECKVAAHTVETGPFTTAIQLVTDETVPTAPPVNVTVIAKTSRTFTLSWNPPAFEEQNGIIRQYMINVTHLETGINFQVVANRTEISFDSLKPTHTYVCHVAAQTIGLGPYSSVIQVELLEDAPISPPQNVRVSAVNSNSIFMTWEPPPLSDQNGFIRGYQVTVTERVTSTTFQVSTNATELTISSLHPFYTYECTVSAITVAQGPYSMKVTVQTLEAAPSGAPINITATPTSPRSAILTWKPPLPDNQNGVIVGYVINITMMDTGGSIHLFSTANNVSFGSLRPYSMYMCQLAAQTSAGVGPYSAVVAFITPEDVPSMPEEPITKTILGSPLQLLVSWQLPSEPNGVILSYTVYCYESQDSDGSGSGGYNNYLLPMLDTITPGTIVQTVAPGNHSQLIVSGLIPYQTYDCYVTANTSAGEGDPSFINSAKTDESVPADPPANFRTSVVNSTVVLLSWSEPLIPYGKIVSYTLTYNASTTPVTVASNENSYLVAGLEEYTLYEFEVFASTRVGAGPSAVTITRTSESYPHSPPREVQSVVTGSRTAIITWQPPALEHQNGPITYYVVVVRDLQFNESDLIINVTSITANLTALEEYDTYSFKVAAATGAGLGPYSDAIVFVTQQDVPSSPPQSFTGFGKSSTVISLMWEPPPPIDINGILQYYVVNVIEMETGWTETYFAVDQLINIDLLHPYYNYECRVAASTLATGPYTNPIVVQTKQTAPSSSPSSLAVANITSRSFQLRWEPPPFEEINGAIKNYVIMMEELDTGITFTVLSNTTEALLYGLHPFYTYECSVAAETIAIGPYSTQITIQLGEEAPTAAPINVNGYAPDSISILLSWSSPPASEHNGIIRNHVISARELDTGDVHTLTTSGTQAVLESLHPAYTYEITIRSVTVAPGPPSIPITVKTLEAAPITSPEDIITTATTPSTALLSWDELDTGQQNGVITGYVINITILQTGETLQVFSNTTSLMLEQLRPFTFYSCIVAAQTSAGIGPFSTTIMFQTEEAAPTAYPDSLSAVPVSTTTIVLSWSPPPPDDHNGIIREYLINITELDSGRKWQLTSTTISVTIHSLHPYYLYECTVSAYTVAAGPYSELIEVRTPEDAPSGYIQDFEVMDATPVSATLSWEPPIPEERNGNITDYIVNITAVATGQNFHYNTELTLLKLEMLAPFSTYLCRIAASTNGGTGPFSVVYTIHTLEDAPTSPPQNLTAASLDPMILLLTWLPPPQEKQNGIVREYRINITEMETGRTFQLLSSTTSLEVSSLHPYYTYEWTASAYTVQEGPYSNKSTIIMPEDVPSGAPQNFTGQVLSSEGIFLTWDPPLSGEQNGIITDYVVTITAVGTTHVLQNTTVSQNIAVGSLKPYTTYACVVAARTSVGTGPVSELVYLLTLEQAPSSHPANITGLALNSTHIHLTWYPPSQEYQHGIIHVYNINITELETGAHLQLTSETTEITIGPLHPYYAYNCTVVAVTVDEGPSSHIIVYTEEDAPSGEPLNFEGRSDTPRSISLLWDPPLQQEQNGIIRKYVITLMTVDNSEVTIVSSISNSQTIHGLRAYTTYLCTVAAYTISVGPATEELQIQTAEDVPTGSPEGFMITPLDSMTLLLTWQPPSLQDRNGIIQQYTINITEVETGAIQQLITEGTNQSLSPLHPFYTYNCSIAAESSVGLGPFSNPQTVQMPEDAPSSAPTGLQSTTITSSTFILSWSSLPVEDHNGIIRHYTLSITEENTGIHFQLTSLTTNTRIEFLHANYNYSCKVAAVTTGTGPYSSPLIVTTHEAVPSGPPLNIHELSSSPSTVILEWDPPLQEDRNGVITGYLVNITEVESGGEFQFSSSTNSLNIDSLTPFTTYTCVIAATTIVGHGPYSNTFVVLTPEDAPTAPPLSVSHTDVTATHVSLSWAPPPTDQQNGIIRQYIVAVVGQGGRNFTVETTQPEVTVGGLHPFYMYSFSIAAITIAPGPYSDEYIVETLEDVPTATPQSLGVVPVNATVLLLTWDPPPEEQQNGIILYYIINGTTVETGEHFQLVSNTTALRIDGLHPFYTYTFTISSVTIGAGPYSSAISVQMPEDAPGSPPRNPVAHSLSSTMISLTWEPPLPELQNGIIRSYTVTLEETISGTISSYIRDGHHIEIVINFLHPFYEYKCSVAAHTVAIGPFTSAVTVVTDEGVPSSYPRNISVHIVDSTTVYLAWEPPPSDTTNGIIREYIIHVSVPTDTTDNFMEVSNATFHTLSNLHPFYTYEIKVAAVTIGPGPYSNASIVTTPQDAPAAAPVDVAAVAVSSSSIRLTWASPPEEEQNGIITSYRITITESETGNVFEFSRDGTDSLIIVNSLHPFYTYLCTVAAFTIGLGPHATVEVQTLQEAPSDAPSIVSVVALNASLAHLTWQPPPLSHINGIITDYIIRIAGVDTIEQLVQEFHTQATNLTIELDPFYTYNFAIATHTIALGPFSAPIDLKMPEAVPSTPVHNVTVDVTSPTSVTISWIPPDPQDWNGIITGYSITYDLIGSVGEDEDSDLQPYSSLTLHFPQTGSNLVNSRDPRLAQLPLQMEMTILNDLHQYQIYQITVFIENMAGEGIGSHPIVQEMPGSEPTGAPTDVTVEVTSSVSLLVFWNAPAKFKQNGIITGYTVLLTSVLNGTTWIYSVSGGTFSIQLEGLQKYWEYSVSVAARTEFGEGPYSIPTLVRTLENVPGRPSDVTLVLMNSTAVTLYWKQPQMPNGVILNYQVAYYGYKSYGLDVRQEGEVIDGPYTYEVTARQYSVVLTKLLPGWTYEFKVRARTSAGYGDNSTTLTITLELPSDSETSGSASSDASVSAVVIAISVAAAVAWLLLTILLVVVIRQRRRKAKKLKLEQTGDILPARKSGTDNVMLQSFSNVYESTEIFRNKGALSEDGKGLPFDENDSKPAKEPHLSGDGYKVSETETTYM